MKCPKCGNSHVIDNGNGKKCVNCNFEWIPKKTSCGTWLVLIFIIMFVVPYFIGKSTYDEYKQKAEQQEAANVQRIMNEAENTPSVSSNNTQPKSVNNVKNDTAPQRNQSSSQKDSNSNSVLNEFGVWHVTAEEDEFNGNKNVFFGNRSTDYFVGMFDQKKYPAMWVRCKDNTTDVLINFDVVMTCHDVMKIGLKFDDEKPYYENWVAGTSCDALFARNPVNLLKKMASKKKLIVKFTPFQRGDMNVTFDLTGIDKVKDKIASVCHWKK